MSLEAVISTIPFGLAVVDRSRRIVLMNAAFHTSLDLDPGRFSPGSKVEDVVRAVAVRDGLGDPEAHARAVLAADRTRHGRLVRRTFAGRSFDIFNTPLSDGGYILSSVEITEALAARADAERALGQTVTSLAGLRIGVAIFDPRGALLLSNPRFAELTGLPPERLTPGFPFRRMLNLIGIRKEYEDRLGAFSGEDLRDRQWTTLRHGGTDRLIDIMYQPLPAGGGWTVSVSDTTPLATAEGEAQRRAHLLDSVLLAVPHGICVYGPDRRVAMVNQTYLDVMAGTPLGIGDHLADVVRRRAEAGEYGGGELDELFAQESGGGSGPDPGRTRMRRRTRANGTAIDIRDAPLPDGGHISVVTDITALVTAETESRYAPRR